MLNFHSWSLGLCFIAADILRAHKYLSVQHGTGPFHFPWHLQMMEELFTGKKCCFLLQHRWKLCQSLLVVQHCSEKHRSLWMGQKDIAASEHPFFICKISKFPWKWKPESTEPNDFNEVTSTFYTREVFTWPVLFSQIGKGYLNPVMAAVTTVGFRKESLPNPCLPGRAGSEGPVTIEKLLVLGKGVILGNPLWFVHWFFFSRNKPEDMNLSITFA